MGQGLESLLSNVASGSTNWPEVYECLKTPLWYAAARGARQVGVRDRDAIAEAVQQAFTEFMDLDFAKVMSPDSIARKIAYRRGLDRGIAARRRWTRETAMESLPADLLRAEPGQAPGYAASAAAEPYATATAAPARPSRSAVARPMPREAPVTRAVFPERLAMVMVLRRWCRRRRSGWRP